MQWLVGILIATSTIAHAQSQTIEVSLGSCQATLRASKAFRKQANGNYRVDAGMLTLSPRGTAIQLPLQISRAVTINPHRLSLPMDARLLPIPRNGLFSQMLASSVAAGPVSAGVDTGANIRKQASGLFLDPNKSYLYFLVTTPFVLDLNKNNRNKNSRAAQTAQPKQPKRRKRKLTTTGFALDPCDPAVFFGGVTANVSGITMTLEGIGVSLRGNVIHKSRIPIWTGRTKRNGQPDYRPLTTRGHVYAKGTAGVGIGKFLSATGSFAATLNLDPRGDGVIGLSEAMALLNGRAPARLPDLRMAMEGSGQIGLPGFSIPFARAILSINTTDPKRITFLASGERLRGAALSDLFPDAPPELTKRIVAKGTQRISIKATFDSTRVKPNGHIQAKVFGKLELGGAMIQGDVDISYRVGGKPRVCAKLPSTPRLCGANLQRTAERLAKQVVKTASSAANEVANSLSVTCPRGFVIGAAQCISKKCPLGYARVGAKCLTTCPPGSRYSVTKAHCITDKVKLNSKTTKVWVGHLKKPKRYRRACPKNTRYSHNLAGYSYCKKESCRRGYPTRRGNHCHRSCQGLRTDAFGNCVVASKPAITRPFGCPRGYQRHGLLCKKR